MVTIKILDKNIAGEALKSDKVFVGQEFHVSSMQYAKSLVEKYPSGFSIVSAMGVKMPLLEIVEAEVEPPHMINHPEEFKEAMKPKKNKQLTKAKTSKYKSKQEQK